MSLSLPSDTSTKPAVAEAPDASKAHPSFWFRILQTVFGWIHPRRDHDALVAAYTEMIRQDVQKTILLHNLAHRLAYYEDNIPRMRELARQLEQERMGVRKPTSRVIELTS